MTIKKFDLTKPIGALEAFLTTFKQRIEQYKAQTSTESKRWVAEYEKDIIPYQKAIDILKSENINSESTEKERKKWRGLNING